MVVLLIFTPYLFFAESKNLFDNYGMLAGAVAGIIFEERFVKFEIEQCLWKKGLRLVVGLLVCLAFKEGLKLVFPSINVFHMIRYFFVSFSCIGLYPWLFKKLKF